MLGETDLLRLREAFEASWQPDTAYLEVFEEGNPALGQCYPTSRVLQLLHPEFEIVEGEVWTGTSTEKHFWNIRTFGEDTIHVDLTWQQFPHGSQVTSFHIRDSETLGDGPKTIERVDLLLSRVKTHLAS